MESEIDPNENNEVSVATPTTNDVTTKVDEKESIEDRYNKLRGFAVKLKRKVSDLSEQLQKCETEKIKINADKEELQNKVLQISDNAKKLQTIQSEYDKLQDDLEQQKNDNKKINKSFESVILENTSLKESLYEKKETVARLTAEVERLTKEQARLEAALKQSQELTKELKEEKKVEVVMREQKDKKYEEMKNALNSEKEAHKITKAQLDASKQECNTKSVLSLEVQNYERSVEDLKAKLDDETVKRTELEEVIEEHLGTIENLKVQIAELRDTCLTKTNQITILGEKNEDIKQELCEAQRVSAEEKKKMEDLIEELATFKQNRGGLMEKIEALTVERDQALEGMKKQESTCKEQIKGLEGEILNLNAAVARSAEELDTLRGEFTGYKLRAQSVLRTRESQNKKGAGRSVAEIEEELEQTRTHAALLRDRLDNYTSKLEALTTEISQVKEERDHAIAIEKESRQKILTMRQELASAMDQLRSKANEFQLMQHQHKEEIESLHEFHKSNRMALEEKHQSELNKLQNEVQKPLLRAPGEISTIQNSLSDKHAEQSSEIEHQPKLTGMALLEREEGEGSESVDSFPSAATALERNRKHSLMPLDELLNSSDDFQAMAPAPLSPTVDRQALEVCERRVKHLTVLLADAERDIAKLTQLNQLLKEDIRRQQRSVEREQHANNFEYLKNVVFKFVTLKNCDERSHLIPVLNTILKLSPEETQKLNAVAGVSGRGWIPGIPIPGWTNI